MRTQHHAREGCKLSSVPSVATFQATRVPQIAKRLFDLVFASILLVVVLPVLAVIAVAICLETPGGPIFRQERRARNGGVFRIVKFRTMTVGAEVLRDQLLHRNCADWPLFKIKDGDPRLTRVGRFLRTWSLDELPQLWNVVRGDMSLVGPRPLVLCEADQINDAGTARFDVRPGMTGLWQVCGRHELGLGDMLRLDCDYVEDWSFARDILILLRTAKVVVTRTGAY